MSLPKRWLPYSPVGKPIPGTPFVAFKVPLKETLCRRVAPEDRFSPETLLGMLPNLSAVVDLTFTTRYYDGIQEFAKKGVLYRKVAIPGKEVPRNNEVNRFFAAVESVLVSGSSKSHLIGVHCTHGVNRTGYLICKYMIDRLGINPDTAITLFEEARGHKIERENYVNELRRPGSNQAPRNMNQPFATRSRQRKRDRPSKRDRHRQNESSAPVDNGFFNGFSQMLQNPAGNSCQPENTKMKYPDSNFYNSRKTEDFRQSNFRGRDSRSHDQSNTEFSHYNQQTRGQNIDINMYDSKPIESRDNVYQFTGNQHFSGNLEYNSNSYGQRFENDFGSSRRPQDRFTDSYRNNSPGYGNNSWRQNKPRWVSNSSEQRVSRRDTSIGNRGNPDVDFYRPGRFSEHNSSPSIKVSPSQSDKKNDHSPKKSYNMRINTSGNFYPQFSTASNTNELQRNPKSQFSEPKFYEGYVPLSKKYNESGDPL